MATFSTNQVRQLYVVTSYQSSKLSNFNSPGTIFVKSDQAKSHLYFSYRGADNLMRSDLIDIKNILYAKSTDSRFTNLKSFIISLDAGVNGGSPVSGQDYILRIAFRHYVGMSDEDQYFKYGMVHAYAGMTTDKFYKTLALSLAKNFSREVVPLVKIEVHSAATKDEGEFDETGYMEVTPTTKDTGVSNSTNPYWGASSIVTDIDSIRITEVEQPWRRGIMEQTPVYFTVQPVAVMVNGDERIWATVTEGTNGTIGNGKKIADLEYFCMGERGDIYRGIGYPNNIPTTYLVDPNKTYYTFDIHYAYTGNNESNQKSEKDITIVSANKTAFNAVITAFNNATGFAVKTIS